MNHQKLHCYNVLISVAKKMPGLIRMLPRGENYIIDQLRRALTSAILNLAEGNGRTSQKERNRFFDISLASIAETAAAIDVIFAYGYLQAKSEAELKTQLRTAYAMIRHLRK